MSLMSKKMGLAARKSKDDAPATSSDEHEKEMEAFYAHQVRSTVVSLPSESLEFMDGRESEKQEVGLRGYAP